MAEKNTIRVLIGGKIVTLCGYESPEYLQKVALYMDGKISELSEQPGYSRQPMETKNLLLSLNISDDYFKAKNQAEIYEQDAKSKDQEMFDLKHELISVQMELDHLKAENQELEMKAQELETELNELLK